MKDHISLRPITHADNAAIAGVIRSTLIEFGAARPGTVYFDESTDHLSEVFDTAGATYYIAEQQGVVVGGAGIYPTAGLDQATCELVKMYLLADVRGQGIGRMLMDACIRFAGQHGYRHVYLETMPELAQAIGLYEKMGFVRLSAPMGTTGHFGCGIWMLRELQV